MAASALPAAPAPKTALGRYRILSPSASVRVSPLCLGTMNFGTAWAEFMGPCDQQATEEILDFYYDCGGNFIDTSNNYQYEQAETWLGEWMAKRGNRDEMVIATKYSINYKGGRHDSPPIGANFTGNSTKSMRVSVNDSLKKLQTDYIDLFYVHWWDFSTSVEEVMQSLNQLVQSGKVLYLGVSDTPAWVVAKANQYARDHGLRTFSVYQGKWSAASRDFERDIIPMCREEGMALTAWGALGGGSFKTEEQRRMSQGRNDPPNPTAIAVSRALEAIARRKGTKITSVALAYVMHKTPYVFPVIGGRSTAHLKDNIEALSLVLTREEMDEIEGAAPFDPGFPMTMLYGEKISEQPSNTWLTRVGGVFDYVPLPKPIAPSDT